MQALIIEWNQDGRDRRLRIPFGRKILIGRAPDCEIRLTSPFVSRLHAELRYEDGALQIRNLSSTNPVTLNGDVVLDSQASAILSAGDEFQIGRIDMRVGSITRVQTGRLEKSLEPRCPSCRGSLDPEATKCLWCGASLAGTNLETLTYRKWR